MFLPRLYAILDVDLARQRELVPETVFEGWLEAGVRLIQLRAKSMPGGLMLDLAARLAVRAHAHGARLIVNDRADVARLAGADGVHVGQDDLPPGEIRRVISSGPGGGRSDAIVGLSSHNEAQVRSALREPINYLAFGPVFATLTKRRPDPVVGLGGVRQASALAAPSGLPLVAIGGIGLNDARSVIDAGAGAVAVAGDLITRDATARARALLGVLLSVLALAVSSTPHVLPTS